MQLSIFPTIDYSQLVEDIFTAYFDCRKNKRNTLNALKFEKYLEENIFKLIDDIYYGDYQLKRCIAFIVNTPVKREIFAADFTDRVVHHWLINKLNPLFENLFIQDSYACRTGKGTHFGIKRIDVFIKSCSGNYIKDCYILKLDIQGFFMHINRNLLFSKLAAFIHEYYHHPDKNLVLAITQKIIFNDPIQNCIIKGSGKDWEGLPQNKSLFHSPPDCGMPIGNLTSQVFANFYMHQFDSFVVHEMGFKYYGRYVDDFVLVHENKDQLISIIPKLANFLQCQLFLTLHPHKIYLQHYSKGVRFLGTIIKPNRIYIANRTKGNFFNAIEKQNHKILKHAPTKADKSAFISSMNAYLGLMQHYKSFKLRKRMLAQQLSHNWLKYVQLITGATKFVLKKGRRAN